MLALLCAVQKWERACVCVWCRPQSVVSRILNIRFWPDIVVSYYTQYTSTNIYRYIKHSKILVVGATGRERVIAFCSIHDRATQKKTLHPAIFIFGVFAQDICRLNFSCELDGIYQLGGISIRYFSGSIQRVISCVWRKKQRVSCWHQNLPFDVQNENFCRNF